MHGGHDTESGAAHPLGPVTYRLKVLSAVADENGKEVRTVLFQRTSARDSIEISAETDAPNLLAKLPELLEAALEVQRAVIHPSSSFPRLAEESRLVRRLVVGVPEETPQCGVLRLIGTAYRKLSTEAPRPSG
jgi:hypothetical protein